MNWDAIAAIAETAGLLLIIVTLLYLSNQIRQSVNATKTNTLLAAVGNYDTVLLPIQNDAELARIALEGLRTDPMASDALSAPDRLRFHFWMSSMVLHYMELTGVHQLGSLDEDQFDRWRNYTAQVLATAGGQAWWQTNKTIWPEDLWRQLDEATAKVTPIDQFSPYFKG